MRLGALSAFAMALLPRLTSGFVHDRRALLRTMMLSGGSIATTTSRFLSSPAGASSAIEVLPKGLIDAKGKAFDESRSKELQELVTGRRVALYFGAGWCPMCRDLEFMLPQYRNALEDSEQPIQLIYVSSDRSLEMQLDRMEKLDISLGVSVEDPLSDKLKLEYEIWSGMEAKMNPAFEGKTRRGGVPAFVALDSSTGKELMYIDTESQTISALSNWPLDDPNGIF